MYMCFLPSTGISARIFAKWLELPTLNEINDLIETGFVQTTKRRTISLHPMIQEITLSETKPSVSSCHTLLDCVCKREVESLRFRRKRQCLNLCRNNECI